MKQNKEYFYITTPIYFPSGNPHIGHCYSTVLCDCIARFKRFEGKKVLFSTGTDEHGAKLESVAKAAGFENPKDYIDGIVDKFQKLWEYMGVNYDRFVRTTDDYHIQTVQKIFTDLHEKGFIYKGEYSGKYCVPCESFWTDAQLVKSEKDGKEIHCCPDCKREVTENRSEESYFLKMQPFAEKIKKLISETDYLNPKNRAAELINNFIKKGLEDLCVSRTSVKWGIPVPFDEEHTVYVWLDALVNYISLLGYGNNQFDDFENYWSNSDNCEKMHITAKEIMRFHAIVWIAILSGAEISLPDKLYSHGWIVYKDGDKMSKSKGNVVDPFVLGERYGVDALRYQILRDMPYASDMPYSNENMIGRINLDLANSLGNLVSRTASMIEKYFGGVIPSYNETVETEFGKDLKSRAETLRDKVFALVNVPKIGDALSEIFEVVGRSNKYIDETSPWVLAKDENKKAELSNVMRNLAETIRITTILLAPAMPNAMTKAWERLGLEGDILSYENSAVFYVIPENTVTKKGENLFPRFDVKKEIEYLESIY